MPAEGENVGEHIARKYGSTPEQSAANRAMISERAAEAWPGFRMQMGPDSRIWNTFDAHRLLHWAELEGESGQQLALKKALLQAYFTDGQSPEAHAVLVAAAAGVGLDARRAQAVLAGDEYADEVREREQMFSRAGIRSVPAIIINRQHLISGGQPVAVFEQALRQIAAGA